MIVQKKQITAEQFANYFSPMFKQARVDKKKVYGIPVQYSQQI